MKLIEVKKIIEGNYLSFYNAKYLNEKNEIKIYEFVSRNKNLSIDNLISDKPSGVCMIIFNETKTKLLLLKEFRLTVNEYVYNLPEGLIEKDETICEASKRELEEETGLKLVSVDNVLPPSLAEEGITNDLLVYVYGIARGRIKMTSFSNEVIEPLWVSKEDALNLIKQNVLFSSRAEVVVNDFIKE